MANFLKNILVTGGSGQLGRELRQLTTGPDKNFRFFFPESRELDIRDETGVREFLIRNDIRTIINCASYTAVDRAESEPEIVRAVNTEGASVLARICAERAILLIHLSTDYVFDGCGGTPYREEDPCAPLSVYGASKRDGEKRISASGCNSVIIRTAWLYSAYGSNFVKTISRLIRSKKELDIVFDQTGTPTCAADLAGLLLSLLQRDLSEYRGEIFHYSGEGACSWYDFAVKIAELERSGCRIRPIRTAEYPLPARRPAYSVLDKSKIKRVFGIEIPHWEESLRRFRNSLPDGFGGL